MPIVKSLSKAQIKALYGVLTNFLEGDKPYADRIGRGPGSRDDQRRRWALDLRDRIGDLGLSDESLVDLARMVGRFPYTLLETKSGRAPKTWLRLVNSAVLTVARAAELPTEVLPDWGGVLAIADEPTDPTPDPEPEPLSDDSEFSDPDRPTDSELAIAAGWDTEELAAGSVDGAITDTLDAHESLNEASSDESEPPSLDLDSIEPAPAPESRSEGNVDDSRTVPYGWASIEADDDESDEGPSDPPSVPRIADLDPFTRAYLEMALDLDADGLSLDDIADASLIEHAEACRQFQEAGAADLEGRNLIRAGQDFWLTRNKHGAGYWDGDYPNGAGRRLTDAAHAWGSSDAYVGDDGYVYLT